MDIAERKKQNRANEFIGNSVRRLLLGGRSIVVKFTVVLGVVGSIASITGLGGTWSILGPAITVIIFGVMYAWWKGRPEYIPAIARPFSSDAHYYCDYATGEELKEACDLTRDSYGRDYVNHDIAEQWRLKNSKAFVAIKNDHGRLCACFGLIGLRNESFNMFIRGDISESSFRSDDILNFSQTKKADRLYISGVIVTEPGRLSGSKRALVMIWCMLQYIRKLYSLKHERSIFALAVSKQGEELLRKTGFRLETPKDARQDKHDLYELELTSKEWDRIHELYGDWKSCCDIKF